MVPEAWRVTDAELAALDALGKEGVWRVGGDELKLTNLDKTLFEADPPITKRELIRYFARIAPTMLPPPRRPAAQPAAVPQRRRRARVLAEGHPGDRADLADPLARDRRRRPRGPRRQRPPLADRAATLAWLGNQASFEIHAWTGRLPEPWQPTFAYIDIDPGEATTWDETLVLARLYRTALGHLGVRGYPEDDRQARHPDLDPDRAALPLRRDERLGRARLAGRRVDRPGARLLGVGEGRAQGPGAARLHPEREHQDARRAVRRPARAGAPVSAPIAWDELDDPDLRPDRWTIRTIVERVAERGDLFAAAQTDAQELPAV